MFLEMMVNSIEKGSFLFVRGVVGYKSQRMRTGLSYALTDKCNVVLRSELLCIRVELFGCGGLL
jgi:hypothetical protein